MFFTVRFILSCSCIALAFFFQNIVSQKTAFAKTKPKSLVLQWEVLHPRNTDQISLIFRQRTMELVVNTSHWQKNQKSPRLGRFGSDITPQLKSMKRRIQRSYTRLKQTVPLLSLVGDSRLRSSPSPHAPVLKINGEKIEEGHPYFKPLTNIIRQIWQNEWICLECATYQRKGNKILRTLQGINTGLDSKRREGEGTQKKIFSKKELDCVSKTKGKMECVDSRFGIFEI